MDGDDHLTEYNDGIVEEYRRFPRWMWLAIAGALVWAFVIGPFGLVTPG